MNRYKYIFSYAVICLSVIACSPEEVSDSDDTTAEIETPTTPEEPVTPPEEPTVDPDLMIDPETGLAVDGSPAENFDLSQWNLSIPIREVDGTATDIRTSSLVDGYQNNNYFYTDTTDGAMVFKNFIIGAKTSLNTKFTRSEFREMIYGTRYDTQNGLSTRDFANNWVFGSSDESIKARAGGVDGELTATLKVDHVTTTGNNGQVGRTVIGQIHASDDEPCRLYYRKLPANEKGSIYFAHEPAASTNLDEEWYELIGSRSSSASNPEDGIALGEVFSYSIKVVNNDLTVTIIREGKPDVSQTIDMSNSGFANDYMYFKAGVYTQNDSGNGTDYDQASFYALEVTH